MCTSIELQAVVPNDPFITAKRQPDADKIENAQVT